MKTKTTIISLLTAAILAGGLFLLIKKQIPETKEVVNIDSTVVAICPAKQPVEEKPLICTPPPVSHPAQAEAQRQKKAKDPRSTRRTDGRRFDCRWCRYSTRL